MEHVLRDAILNGFYDQNYPGHEILGPSLLSNNHEDKIWLTLRRELLTCQSFTWAVAFITEDMLIPLKVVMADLARKNITGTLITGDYLNFNRPKVFKELQKISNLKILIAKSTGFHAKAYLFKHADFTTVVIGSANFTRAALLSNYEWSMKVSSRENAAFTREIKQQLQNLIKNSMPLTNEWLAAYQRNWTAPVNPNKQLSSRTIIPNQMQKAALQNLTALVKKGAQRALVVSATGTGKTYLDAFAVRKYRPRHFLYIVHRRQIAEKSRSSFYKVIGGPKKDFGLLTGKQQDLQAKYLFATIQTLTSPEVLAKLKAQEFDYILIDEAHRIAAPSYQKILRHFKPKFLLGMTATPERTDKQNIYRLFDYNLAYEIRLKDALKDKMLTPFHYVGIEDYEENGEIVDETSSLRYLTAQKRVKYILRELNYYGYCGSRPRGLVFCSRQEEAIKIAQEFSKLGHPATALSYCDSESKRLMAVKNLEKGKLEYIISVDLFNEGIDIPSLNQIVMLRNTQSSIVFIQQLGRGLRKYPHKDFVTVLDFIGNYKNNYLIPLALNDDRSCNQDTARREVKLPQLLDLSTINFSRIASQRILQSLDKIKLDSMFNLRQAYRELKQKIGHVPLLKDFYQYGSVSPLVFARNNSLDNYGAFLQKMGEDIVLSSIQNGILTFFNKELLAGKRIHELLLLDLLLKQGKIAQTAYQAELKKRHAYVNKEVLASVENILSLSFFAVKVGKTTKRKRYGGKSLIKKAGQKYYFSDKVQHELGNPVFKKLFADVIQTGLLLNQNYNNQEQFTLYKQYDREDVCRLLNWPLDVSAPMYGYRVGQKETPIFITYKKDSAKKRNSIYNNQLSDGRSLRWYTRTPRHLSSDEVKRLLEPQMKLYLFVKRSDAVGKEFFYLGQATILHKTVKEEKIGPKQKDAVGMNLLLQHPLASSMYDLLFKD